MIARPAGRLAARLAVLAGLAASLGSSPANTARVSEVRLPATGAAHHVTLMMSAEVTAGADEVRLEVQTASFGEVVAIRVVPDDPALEMKTFGYPDYGEYTGLHLRCAVTGDCNLGFSIEQSSGPTNTLLVRAVAFKEQGGCGSPDEYLPGDFLLRVDEP